MAPLGVHVLTIISGEIGTNILKTDVLAGRALPSDSYYAPLADDFKNHILRTPSKCLPPAPLVAVNSFFWVPLGT